MSDDGGAAQAAIDAAFGAGPADRAANRDGRLSARQRRQLAGGAAWGGLGGALASSVGVVALVEHAVVGGVALVVGAVLFGRVAAPLRDASAGRVALEDGRIARIGRGATAEINGTWIVFPPGLLDELPADVARWRVYYVPRSRRVVALEPAPSTELGPFR